jgi:small subunit ribosomal protein S15
MARMHSRKKGKSGSTKPTELKKPSWERYDEKEITLLIQKLSKQEKTASEIGIILRDTYGIPDVKTITKKKITQILHQQNITTKLPEDLTFLIKKAIKIMKHMELNKKDQPSKRGLTLTESKIGRLVKYYKKTNKISQDWKYTREKIKLLIE